MILLIILRHMKFHCRQITEATFSFHLFVYSGTKTKKIYIGNIKKMVAKSVCSCLISIYTRRIALCHRIHLHIAPTWMFLFQFLALQLKFVYNVYMDKSFNALNNPSKLHTDFGDDYIVSTIQQPFNIHEMRKFLDKSWFDLFFLSQFDFIQKTTDSLFIWLSKSPRLLDPHLNLLK